MNENARVSKDNNDMIETISMRELQLQTIKEKLGCERESNSKMIITLKSMERTVNGLRLKEAETAAVMDGQLQHVSESLEKKSKQISELQQSHGIIINLIFIIHTIPLNVHRMSTR